jgi:hypothetical protein
MSQATDYAGVEEAAGFQPSGVSRSDYCTRKAAEQLCRAERGGFRCEGFSPGQPRPAICLHSVVQPSDVLY